MGAPMKEELINPRVLDLIERAKEDFVSFWGETADNFSDEVRWFRKWDQVFSWDENKPYKWFVNGKTNVSYNCLEKNVKMGRGGKAALIEESGERGETRVVTYSQLLHLVKKYSKALRGLGVGKGDPVAIYMPPSIESIASMLACARIGAIHVVIFAGFSSKAVSDRLNISGAKFLLTQDYSSRRGKLIPLKKTVDEALSTSPNVNKVVVLRKFEDLDLEMEKGRDINWEEFLDLGRGEKSKLVEMDSNDPLFLLPTSGTTAMPKVTVQNHGGYQVYVYTMAKWVYGLEERDVWFCTSDIGWIVGHSYNVYGPLLVGCSSIIYEGTPDYPSGDVWWEIIERNEVTGWWVSPTGIRALMRLGKEYPERYDLSSVERVFSAGEVLNPAAWKWLQKDVFSGRVPVIDHMWQTETSGPIIANPYGLGLIPIKPGSASIPLPGIMAKILDERSGKELPPGRKGVLVIEKPFPGLTPTLWREHERYLKEYWMKFPGKRVYCTGDAAYFDEDGYLWFVGRSDEVIKISAHRIGTIEIENALISHPAVAEAGVSGVPDELRGEVACAFVVLMPGYEPSEELKKDLKEHVRKTIGPIAVIRDIEFVKALPKTRSGKIMRRVMKALWLNKDLGDLSTIEEEASIDEIREAIRRMKE